MLLPSEFGHSKYDCPGPRGTEFYLVIPKGGLLDPTYPFWLVGEREIPVYQPVSKQASQ